MIYFSKESYIKSTIKNNQIETFIYSDYSNINNEIEKQLLNDGESQWIFGIPLGPIAIYFDDVRKKWKIIRNKRSELWLRTICEFGWYRIGLDSELFQPKLKLI